MLDVLNLLKSSFPADTEFEVSVGSVGPDDVKLGDVDLDDVDTITLIDTEDNVYGVTSQTKRGDIRPTAVFDAGDGEEYLWIFDKPVSMSSLKGTGLSPDMVFGELVSFDGSRVNAQDLIFPDKMSMGFGTSSETRPGKWKSVSSTKSEFISYLNKHEVGHKDGTCFTQGELLDGKRSSLSVVQNFVMVFDIDIGMPEEDITDRLSEYGYEYILYSTHSHMKNETKIKRDAFFKWSKEDPEKEVKISSIKSYLTDHKKYLPEVVDRLVVKHDAKATSNGVMTVVEHNPMPKFRIVFFLSTPFVFQGRFNQKEKILEWKERYYGLAHLLGLPIDKSCVDPGRLFYFGRHAKGAQFSTIYANGEPLVLESIERMSVKEMETAKKDVYEAAGSAMGGDDYENIEHEGFNLREWAAKYADVFNIQDALEDTGFDEFRDDRSHKDGVHIQCPHEDGHTEAGGNGTYVLNASDSENGFLVHCMHDSCSGRDRLDFIKAMLEEGTFSVEDLSNPDFMCEEEIEVEEEPDDGESKPKKVSKKVKKFSEEWFEAKIEKMDMRSTNQFKIIKSIVESDDIPDGLANDMVQRIAKATNVTAKKMKDFATNCENQLRKEREAEGLDTRSVYFDDETREVVSKLNETLYFANNACKVLRKTNDINGSVTYEVKSTYDMFNMFSNQQHTLRGEDKSSNVFDVWMKSPERNTCEGLTYQPRKPERIYRADGNTVFVNTYSEFTRWDDEDPESSWDLMKDHILTIMCDDDEDLYNRFMLFFANIIQNPDKKYAQTLIVKGQIGCGKSIVMDFMREIIGRNAIEVNDASSITGKFNDHLAEKLLVVLDEGDMKKSMSKLKNIISSKVLEIEPKGLAKVWVANCVRIVVTTNSQDTVDVALGSERRFFVLNCSDEWVQSANSPQKDKEAKSKYFGAITNQMEEQGGLDQMFYDLKTWDPADHGLSFANDLMMAPLTSGLMEESATSISPEIAYLVEMVQNGYFPEVQAIDLDELGLFEEDPTSIPKKKVHQHIYNKMDKVRSSERRTPQTVARMLNKVLGVGHVRQKKPDYPDMLKYDSYEDCYVFPPIEDMVAHMIKNGYLEKDVDIEK